MVRTSRRSAAAAALRSPTPPKIDPSDDEAEDVPMQDDSRDEDDVEPNLEEEDEDPATPAPDSDADSQAATPAGGRGSTRSRRRGVRVRGRGRGRSAQMDQDGRDAGSDTMTPRKTRGRGRGFGGGRWGKPRGGPSHVTQVPLDKAGNMANVIDDEVELPEDAEGEEKVDKDGNLKGNREYRVRTFPIEGKGDRLYMLSTEPARCIGFRDSYLFFQKHPQLFKIILEEDAKKDLIERSLIPHSYKGRAIGVVTARSVFREFGAKIIIGGKWIIDDYQVAAARAEGQVEGEYAVPEDNIPVNGDEYDRNRFVAWHGASAVYHTGAPSVPAINGKPLDAKKRKPIVTGTNWMLEHARAASQFNTSLAINRRQNLDGVYDVHTNIMQYPKTMQHTHAKWEQLHAETAPVTPQNMPNGKMDGDDINGDGSIGHEPKQATDTLFTSLPDQFARNFTIVDTYAHGPPTSTFGFPGLSGSVVDVGPTALTDISEDIVAMLPEASKIAFLEMREDARKWQSSWSTEAEDKMRAKVHITYNM